MVSKRIKTHIMQILIDICLIAAAYVLAIIVKHFLGAASSFPEVLFGVVFTITTIATMALFGCNRGLWKYTGTVDTLRIVAAVTVSLLFLTITKYVLIERFEDILLENAFIVLYALFSILLLIIPRFFNRIVKSLKHTLTYNKLIQQGANIKRALIYGAGYTGRQVAERFIANEDGYIPFAFIDDDPEKKGLSISGIKIIGGRDQLKSTVELYNIDAIIIAIQQISKKELKEIYQVCAATGKPVKVTPNISSGEQFLNTGTMLLRDVKMEELLGREPFEVNMSLINHFIKGKTILVTGGAGSIGSELCRQSLNFDCAKLIALDWHENSLFLLNEELTLKYPQNKYEIVVANIRDKNRLKTVFEKYKPDVVFHAAAYKHVPVMEHSPVEAIKNNVFGTKNVIETCNACGVKKFILISTDKAVNPANVMGASKRIAEMVVQTQSKSSETQMAAVRFGNVLGSNGSVIGIFLEQIQKGGPVTLTHKDIKRYFMTIPEACKLVLQAGALASMGEVFVLDMGEPVYIRDLAADLIKMNGLTPGKDIEIKVTGLRSGEKLFEELKFDNEACDKTLHEGIFVCKLEDIDGGGFEKQLGNLESAINTEDNEEMIKNIFRIVPSVYREQEEARQAELKRTSNVMQDETQSTPANLADDSFI